MAGIGAERLLAADFKYNVISIVNGGPGQYPVITYSVTHLDGTTPYDLFADPAWTTPGAGLNLRIGWDTVDFNNSYSNTNLIDVLSGRPYSRGAAMPIPINARGKSVIANADGTYTATSPLPVPATATGTGEVLMDGHPMDPVTKVAVPVKSAYNYFSITSAIQPRRAVVDINKCMRCHKSDGTGVAPRLAMHGSNRTEEIQVCVVCHNPNNTDIPFRRATDPQVVVGPYAYPEQALDFKRLVHGIHATTAGFRDTPLVVIGFNHTVFDASTLKEFPAKLRNCVNCHIDNGKTGTFELPLGAGVRGSTFNTQSNVETPNDPNRTFIVDAIPTNDVKISPTAAVCSSCHDEREVISHMISTGYANFLMSPLATNRERCASCHGPGKDKSVRKVHLGD